MENPCRLLKGNKNALPIIEAHAKSDGYSIAANPDDGGNCWVKAGDRFIDRLNADMPPFVVESKFISGQRYLVTPKDAPQTPHPIIANSERYRSAKVQTNLVSVTELITSPLVDIPTYDIENSLKLFIMGDEVSKPNVGVEIFWETNDSMALPRRTFLFTIAAINMELSFKKIAKMENVPPEAAPVQTTAPKTKAHTKAKPAPKKPKPEVKPEPPKQEFRRSNKKGYEFTDEYDLMMRRAEERPGLKAKVEMLHTLGPVMTSHGSNVVGAIRAAIHEEEVQDMEEVIFVVDHTGSMGNDISEIYHNMGKIEKELTASADESGLGLVSFRDNEILVRHHLHEGGSVFGDVAAVGTYLQYLARDTNGDMEYIAEAANTALLDMNSRSTFLPLDKKVKRKIILITDEGGNFKPGRDLPSVKKAIKDAGVEFITIMLNHDIMLCFTGSANVLLADGTTKTMEELYEISLHGELPKIATLSDKACIDNGECDQAPSSGKIIKHEAADKEITTLKWESNGRTGEIEATPNHKIAIKDENGKISYEEIGILNQGSQIYLKDIGFVKVTGTTTETRKGIPVYDLMIENNNHNFFIDGILVHNKPMI